MNRRLSIALLLVPVLVLGACRGDDAPGNPGPAASHSGTGITFANGDITLRAAGAPPATLTRDGGLSIGGKPVVLTPAQRRLLLDYRGQIHAVGMQGMEVGKAGAAVGARAATLALAAVFSGNTADIDKKVEAEAEKVKREALEICDALGQLKIAQDRLAKGLPAFQPYASLGATDVRDCAEDSRG